MSVPLFNLVVYGFHKDCDPAEVKARFSKMFRLEAAQVERVFKAAPIILRRNIPEDFANSLSKRLSAIGVSVRKVNAEVASIESRAMAVEAKVSKAIYYEDRGEISVDASAMHQSVDFFYAAHERRIPFIFTGTGFAYCKLWLVNLLVCILSVGLFYPWAKVRSLSYLYQQVYFDNKNFKCVENSKKIYYLQGLLLTFLTVVGASYFYSFAYFLIALIVLIGLLPFYRYKCDQLQYGHFSFCGLNLRSNTSLRDFYLSTLVWPFLALLTLGFLAPTAAYRIQYHQLHNKYLGRCEFKFLSGVNKYRGLLASLLIAELIITACMYWGTMVPVYLARCIIFLTIFMLFIHWRVVLEKLKWNNLTCPLGYFVCSWSFASYGKLISQSFFLLLVTFGLYWPWVKINFSRYKAEYLAFFANQGFSKWQQSLRNS